MRRNIPAIIFSIIVLTFLLGSPGPDDRGYIVNVGDPCPEFSMTFPDGSTTSLKKLRGKVIMLQFTASWCSVCRKEMPHIEKEIWQEYQDDGLVLIGIDRDEPADVVEKFAREMKISYPLALDPEANILPNLLRRMPVSRET